MKYKHGDVSRENNNQVLETLEQQALLAFQNTYDDEAPLRSLAIKLNFLQLTHSERRLEFLRGIFIG